MVPPQGSTCSGRTKCLLPCCLHGCRGGEGDEERWEPLWEGQAIEEPDTQGRAPAQPSPGTQAVANPTLGKQLAPPRRVLPAALPGAADHGAQGRGEQAEGERDGDFRGQGRIRGVWGSPGKGGNRGTALAHSRAEDIAEERTEEGRGGESRGDERRGGEGQGEKKPQ